MKYTYKWALKGTRQQAVNILHGKYPHDGGINPKNTSVGMCFGCSYTREAYPSVMVPERCEWCPSKHLAKRLGRATCLDGRRDPESIFEAIQIIDEMLEEANHVQ